MSDYSSDSHLHGHIVYWSLYPTYNIDAWSNVRYSYPRSIKYKKLYDWIGYRSG